MPGLSEFAEAKNVENVLIYIADSLRLDYLPESISEKGVTVPTVSASTYTASSIPSMITGRYPAAHKVWGFNDVASTNPPPLLSGENAGMDLRNIWVGIDDPAQKPPNRILGLKKQHTLEVANDGFTIVVHEKGAHAPYDFFNVDYDSSPSYFEDYAGKVDELRDEYRKGAESAAQRFLEMLSSLKSRGILESTLVVFTSDHGELLGEQNRGGVYAHGSPVCPELTRVPTVFMGAGLPAGEEVDWIASGTDVAPTTISARGDSVPPNLDGVDLWSTTPSDERIVRSDFWAKGGRVEYAASSAWDATSGYVNHLGSRTERLAFAIHRKLIKGVQAPANRKRLFGSLPSLISTFAKSEVSYGHPSGRHSKHVVSEFLTEDTGSSVDEVDEEQLRALGYLE